MDRLHKGDVVKHFKYETLNKGDKDLGKYVYYIIEDNAYDVDTDERLVVYRSLYGGKVYVRSYEEFMSEVDHTIYPNIAQKYRFERYS